MYLVNKVYTPIRLARAPCWTPACEAGGRHPDPGRGRAAYPSLWGGVDETMRPNEIFACLFAAMIVHDRFGGPSFSRPSDVVGKDFARLRAWCREKLR